MDDEMHLANPMPWPPAHERHIHTGEAHANMNIAAAIVVQ
ncbi:hypothetical protein MY1884_004285 [Beauveria asiatica]